MTELPQASKQSPRRRLLPPRGGRLRLIAAVAGGVIALDAITKELATQLLAGHEPVVILGGLIQLHFYRNYAGPNNFFQGETVLISLFAILAVAVLLVVATRVVSTISAVAVGLLLGGAIGNLLDRLLREPSPLHGGVVDWLQLTNRTKLMNVSDLAIDAAIAVMLYGAIRIWWQGREPSQAEAAPEGPPALDPAQRPPEGPYG